MARPVKNSCDYFPHDNDMRNHKKIKAIRSTFGIKGYGIWVMILELLTGSDGNVFEYSDMEFELIAGDFGVSVAEIRDVVDYCIKLELLFNERGFIRSESLDERLLPVYEKRKLAKQVSAKQKRLNGKFSSNNDDDNGVTATETPQSKVKESKVNNSSSAASAAKPAIESREEKFKLSLVPFVESYGKEMIRAFFDYWREPNKSQTRMRWEMEKTWDLNLRLKKWQNNQDKFEKGKTTGVIPLPQPKTIPGFTQSIGSAPLPISNGRR